MIRRLHRLTQIDGSAAVLQRACKLPALMAARGAVISLRAIQCGARAPRMESLRPRDPRKAEIARRAWELRVPVIARLHDALDRLIGEAQHETLLNIARHALPLVNAEGDHSFGVVGDFTFDLAAFREKFAATIRTEALQTLNDAGQQMLDEVGWRDPFALPEPAALKFLGERANLLTDVPDQIHQQIEAQIAEGMEAGESIRKLQQRITGTFGAISDGRAKTNASNETAAAYAQARQLGMEQSGVQRKSWVCSHIRSRFTHEEAELDPRNDKIPVGQAFHVGRVRLLGPGIPLTPADNDPGEIINCHCMAYAEEVE